MKNIHIIPTDKPSRFWFYKQTDILLTGLTVEKSKDIDTQHIYITSDEEIKEGDWVIEFQKGDNIGEVHFINGEYVIANDIQKKIILTTDIDLIKDGVQSIDDEFLEWFVKNPNFEEVELANSLVRNSPFDWRTEYKIIIPKETKEETLEETAERILLGEDLDLSDYDKRHILKAMINIAKWQQERSYSEEDLRTAFLEGRANYSSFNKWFEQFKKK